MSPRDEYGELEPKAPKLTWLRTLGGSLFAKTKDDHGTTVAVSVAEDTPGSWDIAIRWPKTDVGSFDPPGRWRTAEEAIAVAERMLADLPRLEKDIRWNKANPTECVRDGDLPAWMGGDS